jgi:hypothetical protein
MGMSLEKETSYIDTAFELTRTGTIFGGGGLVEDFFACSTSGAGGVYPARSPTLTFTGLLASIFNFSAIFSSRPSCAHHLPAIHS